MGLGVGHLDENTTLTEFLIMLTKAYDLVANYRRLNRRYFGGKLPRDTMVVWTRNPDLMGACTLAPASLSVNRGLKTWPKAAEMTLLHEMCHLALGNYGHGKEFQAEMLRLAKVGAFNKIW